MDAKKLLTEQFPEGEEFLRAVATKNTVRNLGARAFIMRRFQTQKITHLGASFFVDKPALRGGLLRTSYEVYYALTFHGLKSFHFQRLELQLMIIKNFSELGQTAIQK